MTVPVNIEVQTFRKGNCEFDRVLSAHVNQYRTVEVFCMDFVKTVRWLLLLKIIR